MSAHTQPARRAAVVIDHDRRQSLLRWILGFGIVSTALHFTHNFVEIDQYPRSDLVSNGVIQAAIVVSWPLFTAIALLGYRLYARRRYAPAHAFLLGYAVFCMVSLGHFVDGSPDIAPFWYATIFTDALAGLAVMAFTARSALGPAAPDAPGGSRWR
jgi:hypothetical protein